jgi:thymidylate kinase
VIFYIPYELKVQADNFRSNNDDFHKKVDDIIREYIEKYKDKTKIVTISGSVEERLKKIFETLEVKENDEL